MRYQLSRKTLVPSNRKFHQGFIAILGSLVVLSVFMIVFGATSKTARVIASNFTIRAKSISLGAIPRSLLRVGSGSSSF